MVALLVGHLGKQMFVKCVEFKVIVRMSAILVIHFKISLLNKPMPSTTSTIEHKMTSTLISSICVGDTTQISPTKIQILLLTIPHKIILILLCFNIALLKFHLYNLGLKSLT